MENTSSTAAHTAFPAGPLQLESLTDALAADELLDGEQRRTLIKLAPISANSRSTLFPYTTLFRSPSIPLRST